MDDLVAEWLDVREQWAAANAEGRSVRTRNRLMDRHWKLGKQIAQDPKLHDVIDALCEPKNDPDVRLTAALVREHWDPAASEKTLLSIIEASGATIRRPVTMIEALSVRTTAAAQSAALCLYNVDEGRGNIGNSTPNSGS